MEYINIISKEEITQAFQLPITIVGWLAIAAVLSTLIYMAIVKNPFKAMSYLFTMGTAGIVFTTITLIVCNAFFRVPTGKYKYTATIDRDKITVSQYEEFIEEYHPVIKDGIYYWEN